jgi:subtilisin family serine protease
MPTPQERITSASRYFFEAALPAASGKSFGQLSNAKVHTAAYTAYSGAAVATPYGQSVTPKFGLQVSGEVPVANGQPQFAASPGAGAAGPSRHILYLRQAADLKVDTEDEIRRVMADVDSFAQLFSAPTPTGPAVNAPAGFDPEVEGPGGAAPAEAAGATTPVASASAGPPGAAVTDAGLRAADWATALVAARGTIGDDLEALTALPAPLQQVAADVEALKTVLMHFFTFDEQGKRYARWAGAGRDPVNPSHLTPEYKRENVRELILPRENTYLYAVVPESLLAPGSALDKTAFREILLRFEETGDEARPWSIATLHTARLRGEVGAYEDFVFFFAEDGSGPAIPTDARSKMAPSLQTFLRQLLDAGTEVEAFLTKSPFTVEQDGKWHVALSVLFDAGGAAVPEGVIAPDTDGWAVVLAVPDKIVPLAMLEAVKHLEPVKNPKTTADLARAEVSFPALETKIAAAKRGGAGVLVGIIDTGIDGSHPAFAGRIHSVWDQDKPALVSGKSPEKNHPDDKKYKGMDMGVEVTKTSSPHTVKDAQDKDGHGTHVAGIAAGAEVKDSAGNVLVPVGFAPNATIVAVRAIGNTNQRNWLLGVLYIFNKAAELGMPCVINMSFGHHEHPHDGSDTNSLALFKYVTDKGKYRPGRIVVAAAGNERRLSNGTALHVARKIPRDIDFGGVKVIASVDLGTLLDTAKGEVLKEERLIAWIKNPTTGTGKNFPLDICVYRKKNASTFEVTDYAKLGKGCKTSFKSVNTIVEISSQIADAVNGDFNIEVDFTSRDGKNPIKLDRWHLLVVNKSIHELDAHVWLPWEKSSFTDFTEADRSHEVIAPAASAAAISVASCNTRLTWTDKAKKSWTSAGTLHEISVFSSRGPLRESSKSVKAHQGITHDFNAIDITAPGCRISAALSKQSSPDARFILNDQAVVKQGTSMASPAMTGMIANLLAEEPALTIADAIARLKAAAAVPAASKFQPKAAVGGAAPVSDDWGYGLVNAGKLKP